ncbi:MAG: GNAT family N-acetyltransferase [Planctomycetes bacterium]|nr:GNAT family N-acetyltransferase [Planctomycetota bacterium]
MKADDAVDLRIRALRKEDVGAIARIDAKHTGKLKRRWWEDVISRHVAGGGASRNRVGLVAVEAGSEQVEGYLLGQVRAFEFGSEPCGWIYAIGVRPDRLRAGVASALLDRARQIFHERKVQVVRTMVRREDVPVLTFFRSRGFAAGPFVELELSTNSEGT